MAFKKRHVGLTIIGSIAAVGILAGCSGLTSSGAPTNAGGDGPPTVAMLLPENVNPRWESQDAPFFEEQLKKLIPDATVEVYNANNDSAKQQQQADQALTKGADVLVVIPVDAAASGVIADTAAASGIPVVAYDRMIDSENVSAWIQADMVAVGEAQAQWLVDHTEDGDSLIQIKGSPTDTNARLFDEGYQNVLTPIYESGERVMAYDTWTQGWDPAIARTSVDQALTKLNNNVQGILASSDGNAAAAIASLEEQGMAGSVPVTGLDGTVQALQLMLQGKQGMTVWRPFDQMGEKTAQVVQRLLAGEGIDDIITGTVTNGIDAEVPQIQTDFYVATDEEGIQYIIDNDPSIEKSDVCTGATASVPFCAGE